MAELRRVVQLLVGAVAVFSCLNGVRGMVSVSEDDPRTIHLQALDKMSRSFLGNLSQCTLNSTMPFQAKVHPPSCVALRTYSIAAGFGRLLAGIAPWLDLPVDDTDEGKMRAEYVNLTLKAFHNVFLNTSCADYVNWSACTGQIVEAAFLGHGLLRMPSVVARMPADLKQAVATNLQLTFHLHEVTSNNWCNFPSILQAALWKYNLSNGTDYIYEAIKLQESWYKGDGAYGDGAHFHWDQYNSFVMHPMLVDAVSVCALKGDPMGAKYDCLLKRMQRWAVVQERMIHPDGSYLIVGRSEHYRFGAFQAISQLALQGKLPHNLPKAQVRTALTGVISRFLFNTDNFIDGWLSAGVNGHQPGMMDSYGDTGALYLTSLGLLQLGLPATDPFWTDPAISCTQAQIWREGKDIGLDEAYDGPAC